MASSYFTLPSFARAKQHKEDLERTNPQDPVLKDEDEKFLNKQISTDEAAPQESQEDATATQIADDGEAKEVPKEEAGGDMVVPETQPEDKDGSNDGNVPDPEEQDPSQLDAPKESTGDGSYDNALKDKAAEAKKARKAKKDRGMELPSQQDAEAATHGFNAQLDQQQEQSRGAKRTWSSYIPSVRPGSRKGADTSTQQQQTSSDATKAEGESTEQTSEGSQDQQQRTWTQYASSYVPSWPSKARKPKKEDPDSKLQPVYNEDGTINETATEEQQQREVSVLLDNLNMSTINNRVFPLTEETQKLYGRFAQCLKDIINGAPTAYEDMDKLMKEAGPKLEEQWKQMPPFVQTLVKSLPARMGSVVGPEVLAMAATEKPNDDMKRRMEAASKPSAGAADSGINIPSSSTEIDGGKKEGEGDEKKSKRKIPGVKSLVGEKSAVASMLRSVVNFLQTRFPFLASTTNVVMSLAVFSKSSIS
jgi:hypothetical protein